MKLVLAILSLTLLLTFSQSSFADIDFQKCQENKDHHCYEYVPQLNTGKQTSPNWHFTAIFPQNGAPKIDAVFSDGNWTHWKNNVAIMWIGNIYTTSSPPTMNFCPPAKLSLLNQDGYLNKLYNVTKGLDLTGFVYPAWCHVETGANPINGDNSIVVPEFPASLGILSGAILLAMVIAYVRLNKKW